MRKPESYLTRLDQKLREIVVDIVRRAQSDAYQAGYRDASENLFKIASETNERVERLVDEQLHPATHAAPH